MKDSSARSVIASGALRRAKGCDCGMATISRSLHRGCVAMLGGGTNRIDGRKKPTSMFLDASARNCCPVD
ncbi:hypothetical protein D3C72_2565300 [compost metagenome]